MFGTITDLADVDVVVYPRRRERLVSGIVRVIQIAVAVRKTDGSNSHRAVVQRLQLETLERSLDGAKVSSHSHATASVSQVGDDHLGDSVFTGAEPDHSVVRERVPDGVAGLVVVGELDRAARGQVHDPPLFLRAHAELVGRDAVQAQCAISVRGDHAAAWCAQKCLWG